MWLVGKLEAHSQRSINSALSFPVDSRTTSDRRPEEVERRWDGQTDPAVPARRTRPEQLKRRYNVVPHALMFPNQASLAKT